MAYSTLNDRVSEERRNPAALENQQQSLKNERQSLENERQANKLREEANRIQEQRLKEQQAANQLASKSIEVQKEISYVQRKYYNEQIKIDSKMLKLAEEHAERERNVTFCRWCGRQMPFVQTIDYLDIEVCSLQCKKMYRQHVIDENRLLQCDCCGNDLVQETVEKDYDNVVIGAISAPGDRSSKIPVPLGAAKALEQTELQSAIIAYLDKFQCCNSKCLTELLSKDETIIDICNSLLSSVEVYIIYDSAMQEIKDCCFEDAITLLDSIPQYSDASEKSAMCKQWIADYAKSVSDTAAKLVNIKTQLNDISEGKKNSLIVYEHKVDIEYISECLNSIKDDFLNAVPQEHLQYKPIKDLLISFEETEALIADIEEKRKNDFGPGCIIFAFIFLFIFIIICIGLAQN